MLGEYKNSMVLWLVQVKHIYDTDYDILGIFETEADVLVAETLYLQRKEDAGLNKEEFTFTKSEYVLGDINY